MVLHVHFNYVWWEKVLGKANNQVCLLLHLIRGVEKQQVGRVTKMKQKKKVECVERQKFTPAYLHRSRHRPCRRTHRYILRQSVGAPHRGCH